MIYQQKGKTCSGFALANAIEQKTGVLVKPSEIYDYFEEHFGSREGGGIKLPQVIQKLKKHPLAGVLVDEAEVLYVQGDNWLKGSKKTIEAILSKDVAVVGSIKIRYKKGEEKIPLNKDFIFEPNDSKIRSYHSVCLKKVATTWRTFWRKLILTENSWGKDFGKEGYFYIDFKEIPEQFRYIYSLTFKDA